MPAKSITNLAGLIDHAQTHSAADIRHTTFAVEGKDLN